MKEELKKIFNYLLLPFSLLFFLLKFLLNRNKNKADHRLNDTEKNSSSLEKEELELKLRSDLHKEKADSLEKEIKEKNEDLDWHKRR